MTKVAEAELLGRNPVHRSDSDENATIEIAFFFAGTELVG
jgi:nucleoside diphosphate kinase